MITNLLVKLINVMHFNYLEWYQLIKEKILHALTKLQHITLPELIDLLAAVLAAILLLYIAFNLLSYLVKISSELFKLLLQAIIIVAILAIIVIVVMNDTRKCIFDFEHYITRCQEPPQSTKSSDKK